MDDSIKDSEHKEGLAVSLRHRSGGFGRLLSGCMYNKNIIISRK